MESAPPIYAIGDPDHRDLSCILNDAVVYSWIISDSQNHPMPMESRAILAERSLNVINAMRCVVAVPLLLAISAMLAGCGGGGATNTGGGGGGGGGGSNPGSFTITLSASSLTLSSTGSQSGSLTVTLNPAGGFSSSPLCAVQGLPTSVNVNDINFSLSSGSPVQLQFTLINLSEAVSGNSTITVACTSGALSAQGQFTLTLQVPPAISLSATLTSFSIYPGNSQNVIVTVNGVGGVTGNVNGTVSGLPAGITLINPTFTASVNNDVLLEFSVASTATTSGTVTVSVTNGTLSATLNISITVLTAPDFVLSSGIYTAQAVYQTSSSTFTVTSADYNGFNQPIAVTFSGIPTGVTFSPSSFTLPAGGSQNVTVSATFSAAANSTPEITVTGTGGGIQHQTQFELLILEATLVLEVQPTSLTVPAGSTGSFEAEIIGTTNGTGTINVQLSAPPSGVTLSPASFSVKGSGGTAPVFVEASSGAAGGKITVTATYGPYTQTAGLTLTIGAAESITPVPLSTSDQMVRTDALTPYTSFPEPNYLVYHAATNRFFSTDAYLNQLNVVDAATNTLKATLDIPGAFGIDQAPDGSVIYVGTMAGDIYVVDPVGLAITKRYPSSSISPYGFVANAVYALANGQLLLEKYFLVPGYSWVDGDGPIAMWNPANNDIVFFTTQGNMNGQTPQKPSCLGGFENVILTNNRSRVLLAPVLTSEGSSLLCSLDPVADTWNWSAQISGGSNSALATFGVSADGNTLAAFDGYKIYNLDPATLNVKNSFPATSSQYVLEYPVMFLSQDGSKVFITDTNGADVLDVYNLATGAEIGWIPDLSLNNQDSYSQSSPFYQAVSSGGWAAGVIQGGGIGLLNTAAVHTLPIGSRFNQTQLDVPYGPAAGGTAVAWLPDTVGVPVPPLGSVYFGANAATDLNNNGYSGMLEAITPAGSPGPVDVRTFATDGGSQFLPLAFSYGPSVLEAATSYATADGGGPASLFGFGLGPQLYTGGSLYVAPPADLQVTVDGKSAPVTSFSPNPYGSLTYFNSPPLPTNSLLYTVPLGVAGTTASIAVENASGSTTASTQLTYLPAVQQYPVDGELIDGVYDPKRNVYYFTDTNQVRVFSLAEGTWDSSIPIPAPKGAYGPQRLFGIALSPDGSKLAITDPGAIAIYVLDPDQPESIQSYAYPQGGLSLADEPGGVAVTNSGIVYFTTFDLAGDGAIAFEVWNSSTGQISTPGNLQGVNYDDPYARLALSADGSRVYVNVEGEVAYFDTVAGQLNYAPSDDQDIGQESEELVLGVNQTTLFANGLILDSNLNTLGLQTLDVAESVDADYVYGAAMSTDGSLVFEPGSQFIDVLDGRTGSFRARVSLPVQLSPNFRALVSDGRDSVLVAITGETGNGIAVINFNSLPEPQAVSYFSAEANRSLAAARVQALRSAEPLSTLALPAFPHKRTFPHRRGALLDPIVRRHSTAIAAQPAATH
jgi:hypothetical protein